MLRELEKFYNTSWVHFRLSLPYFHRSALTSSQPELLQRRRDAHERRRPYLIAVKYMSPSTSLKTSSDRGISLRPCSPLQPALCFRQLLLPTDLIVPTFTFSFDIHPFSSYQKVPHRKRKFCNPHPRPPRHVAGGGEGTRSSFFRQSVVSHSNVQERLATKKVGGRGSGPTERGESFLRAPAPYLVLSASLRLATCPFLNTSSQQQCRSTPSRRPPPSWIRHSSEDVPP